MQICYTYCPDCSLAYSDANLQHPDHYASDHIVFPGVFVLPDFISIEEERNLIKSLDSIPWDPSQSGRRKQVTFCKVFLQVYVSVVSITSGENREII